MLAAEEHLHYLREIVRLQLWFVGNWLRGAFNEKHARMLRETGRFPYPKRYSWCSFKAMREHLKA